MKPDLCGVCNEEIPVHHACVARTETHTDYFYKSTCYHLSCEAKIPNNPCADCGLHRLMCNECKEE